MNAENKDPHEFLSPAQLAKEMGVCKSLALKHMPSMPEFTKLTVRTWRVTRKGYWRWQEGERL